MLQIISHEHVWYGTYDRTSILVQNWLTGVSIGISMTNIMYQKERLYYAYKIAAVHCQTKCITKYTLIFEGHVAHRHYNKKLHNIFIACV
jgi:hypothetical protein